MIAECSVPQSTATRGKGIDPIRPGLTFHGLRHSHKTWLIADKIPEIAQAQRLGHHLSNRLAEAYSHVAPEIQTDLLQALNRRWHSAHRTRRPPDNRPRRKLTKPAPHTPPALRTTRRTRRNGARTQLTTPRRVTVTPKQEAKRLPNPSTRVHPNDHRRQRLTIIDRVKKALRTDTTPNPQDSFKEWS